VKISQFEENIKVPHFDRVPLKGFIYEDVFDLHFFNVIKKLVESILLEGKTKTYLTHSTTFKIGDETKKIISHAQNNREQVVIYDITFLENYHYQSSNTIKKWADETLKTTISPVFYKVIKTIENIEPFANQKDDWIFYRLHLNYLPKGKWLVCHTDSASYITNAKINKNTVDHRDARMCSLTFYFYDQIPGLGGELWTPHGFVYVPKANSMININGHQAYHGVNENLDDKPRLAFTVRACHKDDLYLPGSPDKLLYNLADNLI
jgi:hypothetical protein